MNVYIFLSYSPDWEDLKLGNNFKLTTFYIYIFYILYVFSSSTRDTFYFQISLFINHQTQFFLSIKKKVKTLGEYYRKYREAGSFWAASFKFILFFMYWLCIFAIRFQYSKYIHDSSHVITNSWDEDIIIDKADFGNNLQKCTSSVLVFYFSRSSDSTEVPQYL